MNNKTVYGLESDQGGDTEPPLALMDPHSSNLVGNSQPANDYEIIYELSETVDNEQDIMTWKKYIPADLKKPVTPKLINYAEKKDEPSTSKIKNDDEEININTPRQEKKQLCTSRRRPALEVKALPRSELAEKYDKLIDRRLEIAEYQKRKIEEEIITIEGERKLKYELLGLQIEVEKEKLRQLRK